MAKEVMRVSAEEKALIELLRENGVIGNQSIVNALELYLLPNLIEHTKFLKEENLDTTYASKQLERIISFVKSMATIRDSQM